jgi:glycosyltransferase involved in cell wall biosynthesis
MPAELSKEPTERPWLSAIMPSHNGDRWLPAALDSIVAQNDVGIELVVVDSSDTESTLEILDRYADRLTIRAHRRTDLASWMEKTNFAVEAAAADWISFLHKDDLWLPGRCAALRGWLAAQPASVIHLHPAFIVDEAGKRLGMWHCPLPDGGRPISPQLLLERLLVQNFIAVPTPTIRRDAYLAVGGMDKQLWYTADWDLYLKLLATGDVHYHDDLLACYRIHGSSLTSSGSRGLDDFRGQMTTVVERHIGKLAAGQQEQTRRMAMASIDINVALAAASQGKPARLLGATAKLLSLGPRDVMRYVNHSRIIERTYPRLRARIAGAL